MTKLFTEVAKSLIHVLKAETGPVKITAQDMPAPQTIRDKEHYG